MCWNCPSGQVWGLHVFYTPQIPARVVSVYPRDQLPLCGEGPEPLARESVMPAILLTSKPIISRQEGLSELLTNLSTRPGFGSEPKAATTCFCCCLLFLHKNDVGCLPFLCLCNIQAAIMLKGEAAMQKVWPAAPETATASFLVGKVSDPVL